MNLDRRQCGECTACCTIMEVSELAKPMWANCTHQCKEGCAVYEDRPESCREWFCLWRSDGNGIIVKEHERPDKIGIIANMYQPDGSDLLVVVREARPGGSKSLAAKILTRRFTERSLTMTMRFGSDKPILAGPEKSMREFMKDGKLVLETPDGPEIIWQARKENGDAA